MTFSHTLRASLSPIALIAASHCGMAHAAEPVPAPETPVAETPAADTGEAIIVTAKTTRSATAVTGAEIQKILPGVSPLKAIETLPGVLYISSDPWGNNEQNAQIFIHGFNFQQLGYTLDGLPLGDQNYGNYNGLSPQRAVISEVVGRAVVSTGAGDLGTASTSNLGGAIETFTSDPKKKAGLEVEETVGSYGTSRTFVRADSGTFGTGDTNSAYVAVARQRARAWDFNGVQSGWQVNGKFVHDDAIGKLTAYFDYSQKTEPNEDATSFRIPATTAAQGYTPYIRPYMYPNYGAYKAYLDAYGNTPAAQGSNYNNYYSDAQRTDYLGYLKYEAHLTDKLNLSTQGYYHHNDGAGVVAGALGQSITVIQAYLDPNYATDTHFATNGNGVGNAALGTQLVNATGGSGQVIRTTEYRIDREGVVSALHLDAGAHQIEFGGWYEHNNAKQWRRWYAANGANPASFSPYILPAGPLFTQYQGNATVEDLQLHLQDNWRATERLAIEAGFKTSAQWANGYYPVQPKAGSLSGLGAGGLPQGRINTTKWFLPAFGAKYDLTAHEQLYINVQKNLRQYMTYLGGASLSPWFTGSQSAFNSFATQGKPEESWTYEIGLRTKRTFDGPISALEGQVNYYHVNFSNRQLAISTNPGGIAGGAIAGGTAILVNVGSVHTDGVDAGFTIHAGRHASLYNAVSYNRSTYQSDYTSTAFGVGNATGSCIGGYTVAATGQPNAGVVPTCGKVIPGTPMWMNKTVASLNFGPVEFQAIGDYVGKRYATYVNDTSVPSYFLASARLTAHLPADTLHLAKADVSLNVTNITKETGASTISIGSATNSYSVYPIAPRQWFLTFGGAF